MPWPRERTSPRRKPASRRRTRGRRASSTPSPVAIRPVARADLRVLERAWPGDAHRSLRERHARGELLCLWAWEDASPVGYAVVRWPPRAEGVPEIRAIEVRADRRSHGIGSELLASAERACRERGYARVGIAHLLDNQRARALYERHGFRWDGSPAFEPALDPWDQQDAPTAGIALFLVKELSG